MLNVVSQTLKCWCGYAQKQKNDARGHYRELVKNMSRQWLTEAVELRKAHALNTLEGRIPINRRNAMEEMHRFYRMHFSSLPFRPTFRQLLFWGVQAGSYVPKNFSIPASGRGFCRAMAEAEFMMIMYPAETTLEHTDALFFNSGWKNRYTDDIGGPGIEATEGILGTDERRPVATATPYRNYTYQEAIDCANSIRQQSLDAADEMYGDETGSEIDDSVALAQVRQVLLFITFGSLHVITI